MCFNVDAQLVTAHVDTWILLMSVPYSQNANLLNWWFILVIRSTNMSVVDVFGIDVCPFLFSAL